MIKNLIALTLTLLCIACSQSYNVEGTSSISSLDGSQLYLKAVMDGELKTIDSCDVVHGKFKFSGTLDSATMVHLYMGNTYMLPVVIEEGTVRIKIDAAGSTVGGTELNDSLNSFLSRHKQLENQLEEIYRSGSQKMLEGYTPEEVEAQSQVERMRIAREEDELVTNFICDNFENPLGPGVFQLIVSNYDYPILTAQIEYIMSKAPESFKNNQFVSDYYRVAMKIQEQEQGIDGSETTVPPPDNGTITNDTLR